jgi:hypothetical protein
MGKYLLSFHGGAPGATQEERDASMARWTAWFQQIGASIADPGDGVAPQGFISSSGDVMRGTPEGENAARAVTGYTVINADDVDAAIQIAKGCPILADGGSIEIGELMGLMAEAPEAAGMGAMA